MPHAKLKLRGHIISLPLSLSSASTTHKSLILRKAFYHFAFNLWKCSLFASFLSLSLPAFSVCVSGCDRTHCLPGGEGSRRRRRRLSWPNESTASTKCAPAAPESSSSRIGTVVAKSCVLFGAVEIEVQTIQNPVVFDEPSANSSSVNQSIGLVKGYSPGAEAPAAAVKWITCGEERKRKNKQKEWNYWRAKIGLNKWNR